GTAEDKNELVILKALQFADAIIPTLLTELPICSKDKLTSKLLNFKNLSEPINSSFIPPVKLLNICGKILPQSIFQFDDYYNDIT
ncbi:14055_t:CDS:2, partial [Gigaspora rosea]